MTPITISERGQSTPESPIRKLAVYAEQALKTGVKVYHLNIGQPDIHTPPEFFNALQHFNQKIIAYSRSIGITQLVQSMKQYYHRNKLTHIRTEDIMITTGGSEAILFTLMAIASPGDEVIVFEPFYPNYNGFAHMAGVNLVPVSTRPETGYHLPRRDQIENKISNKTRGILINSPSNPTGTVLRKNEIEMLQDIALNHQLFIISDEVYREFAFDEPYVSLLSFPKIEQYVVMVDSVSKRYSLCGARIGCIISKNSDIIKTVLKFGQARLCSPTLEQLVVSAVVDAGDRYFPGIIQEYKNRRETLVSGLHKIPGVKCKKPEGAFYLMAIFPVDDIEDFCRWLLTDFHVDQSTVMIAPGPGFYATPGMGKQEARIAYILNVQALEKSINILKKGLSVYKQG